MIVYKFLIILFVAKAISSKSLSNIDGNPDPQKSHIWGSRQVEVYEDTGDGPEPFDGLINDSPVNEIDDEDEDSSGNLDDDEAKIERRGLMYKKREEEDSPSDESNADEPTTDSSESTGNENKECVCGLQPRRKVVGGVTASPHEFPWMAAMVYKRFFMCGGSLINNNYILTAAHCVDGIKPENVSDLIMILGAHNIRKKEDEARLHKVKRIIMHPSYRRSVIFADIALLELEEEVEYSEYIRPICLPNAGQEKYVKQNVTNSGWGLLKEATEENGINLPDELQKVTLTTTTNGDCRRRFFPFPIFQSQICAGDYKGGKGSCQGDSGGPLMFKTGDQQELIGVVSFGVGCARETHPGVYTRVTSYLSWIYENTQNATYCQKNII